MRYSSPPVSLSQQQTSTDMYGQSPYAAQSAPQQQQLPRGYGDASAPSAYGAHAYPAAGNMGGWPGMNDATAQMGVQFGKSAVAAGQDYVEKNVSANLMAVLTVDSSHATCHCHY
jgi:hypothetical protein